LASVRVTTSDPEEAAEAAAELLKSSRYAIAFTGAGISQEAGIPTFRGSGGIWARVRPEEVATPEAFLEDPVRVWRWYAERIRAVLTAEPTISHRVLARMEEEGMLRAVITQNVDGLHQRAGSRRVIELHGNILRARCTVCGHRWVLTRAPREDEIPVRCPRCGNLARPDVVWFGEPLPRDALAEAIGEASRADLVLVVGTSGVVEPAASIPLLALQRGARIVNVKYSPVATVNYYGRATLFFEALARRLGLRV